MTRTRLALSTALAVGVAAAPLVGYAATAAPTAADSTNVGTAQLIDLREEERLAGDVYTALAETTEAPIFTRIAASEDRHQQLVEQVLAANDVDVTGLGDTPGTYAVAGYDALYDTWTSVTSAAAAYQVGIDIETADIADLQAITDETDPAVVRVVESLLAGSERHLAAFTASSEGRQVEPGRYGHQPGVGQGGARAGTCDGPAGTTSQQWRSQMHQGRGGGSTAGPGTGMGPWRSR